MIGSTLRDILDEKKISVSELSRMSDIPAQTLYSIIKRDNAKIKFDLLLHLCEVLQTPISRFFPNQTATDDPALSSEEQELLRIYRELDSHGRHIIRVVLLEEAERLKSQPQSAQSPRFIPLYNTPATAGYASPVAGEDYVLHEVPADSPANFATHMKDNSMEPYILDNQIILVTQQSSLTNGDVGLFFIDGDMLCKQYYRDLTGTIHLCSLNPKYQDTDRIVSSDNSASLCCYGKVLLSKQPPLSNESPYINTPASL